MKITNENVSLLGNSIFCKKEEAIAIAKKSRLEQLGLVLWKKMWGYVLSRKDIQGKDALKYAKDLFDSDSDLYVEVLKRNDISWEDTVEYMPIKEKVTILYYILKYKVDMPISQALLYAKELQPRNTLRDYLGCVLNRDDVKNLEAKKLLGLAEELDWNNLWFSISLMPRVQEFMMKVIADKAYFYLNKFICDEMKNVILSRLDIHQSIAIKHLKVAGIPTRISVLKRTDISPQKALYWAKKNDSPLVLEAVLQRNDVKEYLGLGSSLNDNFVDNKNRDSPGERLYQVGEYVFRR